MRIVLTLLMICQAAIIAAQNVQFEHEITTTDNEIIIKFKGKMASGWHVYATKQTGGPTSASFSLEKSIGCSLKGELTEIGTPIKKFDKMFGSEVSYFENEAVFEQHLNIESDNYFFEGYMSYGACNDVSCLPPTSINVKFSGSREKKTLNNADNNQKPTIEVAQININTIENLTTQASEIDKANTSDNDLTNNILWKPVKYDNNTQTDETSSLWLIFLSCFLGGLIALLTPCIWPIIPMTVSFFLKRNTNRSHGIRDSITYGISIIIIYLTLGLSITYIAGPSALNALSTNAIFNILFTIMLLAFGLSFLGAFDINLPSSWSNAVDAKASKTTGLISIFLMAFTLALVSFSCTGPIIGFLLVEVSTIGNFLAPAIGMFGFALALALPFTFFALFPSLLNKLPHSGSWMITIKAILGFIEIAFAFKFFSVADLAYGWHILDRETFIACWASLAIVMGLYLLGIIRLRHDSDSNGIGTIRLVSGTLSLAFAIYMIPGLWGAPLKAISAFTPPMYTQDFNVDKNFPQAQFNDFDEGMEYAIKAGKPALIDFTGYGCVNCRKMEQSVWTDPTIANMLNNNFVLISLYVDDKTALPERIETTENGNKTILRTIGDKWSLLQRYKFGVNAQPFYVTLDNNGELLATPYSFDTNTQNFEKFLLESLQKNSKNLKN